MGSKLVEIHSMQGTMCKYRDSQYKFLRKLELRWVDLLCACYKLLPGVVSQTKSQLKQQSQQDILSSSIFFLLSLLENQKKVEETLLEILNFNRFIYWKNYSIVSKSNKINCHLNFSNSNSTRIFPAHGGNLFPFKIWFICYFQ